jgi:O-acetyl-ADP-ribose deacetylase
MKVHIEEGDLLDQRTEAIVNAWNRNVIPWWLLIPQGVSGAIKRRAGVEPFRELGRVGPIPLGEAVRTGAGRLPYKAIIHVAGIDLLWRSSQRSIGDSVRSAMRVAREIGVRSIAFPIIGAGSGGLGEAAAEQIMLEAFAGIDAELEAVMVRFRPRKSVPSR